MKLKILVPDRMIIKKTRKGIVEKAIPRRLHPYPSFRMRYKAVWLEEVK